MMFVFVCLPYVLLRLCVVNDAKCLVLVMGDVTLVLFEIVKKEEGSVTYVKIVPFVLICVDVCGYPIYLLRAFLFFGGCVENECVKLFYEYVRENSITIGKENQLESVSIGDGIIFDDFLNGVWGGHVDIG